MRVTDDAGVPVAEAVAHAQAELVGVGHLEIVVDEVDFAGHAVEQGRQRTRIAGDSRIPGHAGRAGRAGMIRGIEADFGGRQRELGLLELQVVVQRAVVGAAGAAEDHVLLVGADVVREAEARLEGVVCSARDCCRC